MNFDMKCRICFSLEKSKLLSLFSVKIEESTLAELVVFLSGIEINETEKIFPQMICLDCLNLVSSACETKRKCIKADEALRSYLANVPIEKLGQKNIIIDNCLTIQDSENQDSQDNDSQQTSFILEIVETDDCDKNSKDFQIDDDKKRSSPPKMKETVLLPESKSFSCDICKFSSKRKKNLERHILAVHIKSHKFSCNKCERHYTTQTALKLHLVRDHDGDSPYKCEKCNQKFSCDSLFKIHQQRLICRPRRRKDKDKVYEKSLACSHCDFKTAHQFSLTQHVNLIHLKIRKTWKCAHCDKEFSNRTSLNQHIFNFHNLSHIRCPDCDLNFSNESQLKDHKVSLKCNARKATDDDFEETPDGLICKLCNRSYRNKKEWITHYFNHHKFKTVCDICNVQLSTYASLKNHKKTIHEKIKRFACTQCPKAFSAKHTLDFHLNTHSGLKPFKCKFCHFKASDRSSVSKHQKKLHANKA